MKIKIEPDLFYEACDKIGLMVIQDMPCLRPDAQPTTEEQEEFQRLLEIMIEEHKSYTSIVSWVRTSSGKPNMSYCLRSIGHLQ